MIKEQSSDKYLSFPEGPNLAAIPDELKVLKRWVVWKYAQRPGAKKPTKPPYNAATDELAESNNSATWSTFETACKALETGKYEGLGFMFGYEESNGITYSGVDLDNLTSPEKWEEVNQIIKFFDSYAEISPSKQGVHILFKGSKGEGRPRERTKGVEIYDKTHYFTVTGWKVKGAPATVNEREEQLREFYDKIFSSPEAKNETALAEVRPPVVPVAASGLTDDDIIQRLMNDKNRDKFKQLYTGDTSGYPSSSEADSSFAAMVRFYTRDPAQIKRIMLRSNLKREKWDRKDYLDRTIAGMLKEAERAGWNVWTPAKGRRYQPTPNGNADRFVDMFGEGVLYRIKGDKGTWLLWNKNIWKPDNTLEIENMGREIPRVLYKEAARIEDEDKRKKAIGFALKSDSIASIRAFLDAVKSDRQIARYYRDFDQNPFLLGLPGSEGIILELTETGYRLRQAQKEDMVTMACSVLPATREDKREPVEWLKFLDLIFVKIGKDGKLEPDKELIKYIQKMMGYSLFGQQSQQLFCVFYGTGSNGKSTLLRVWAMILGLTDYATYADVSTFGKKLSDKEIRSDLAAIMKQRVVFVVEGDRKLKLNATLINKWSGGQEPITFRDLFERTGSEWPQGTLVMAVNNKPVITDSNYGIWRRVRLVPFLVNLDTTLGEKKIEDYADILFEKEGDLIFRWMLQGYEEYKRDGLKSPPSVDEATKQYKSESNTVFLFAGDMLKVEGNGRLMSSELIEKYKEYCIAEELDKIDMKEFKEELEKFYDGNILVGNARTRKGIVWRGLKFKDEDDYSLDILTKENELPM
jgi:putative DNA primase/helicase